LENNLILIEKEMLKPSPIIFSELRNLKRNQTTLNRSVKDVGPIMSAK